MGDDDRFGKSCSSVFYHIGPAMHVDEQPILVCWIDVRRCHSSDGHARDLLFLDCDLQTLGQAPQSPLSRSIVASGCRPWRRARALTSSITGAQYTRRSQKRTDGGNTRRRQPSRPQHRLKIQGQFTDLIQKQGGAVGNLFALGLPPL